MTSVMWSCFRNRKGGTKWFVCIIILSTCCLVYQFKSFAEGLAKVLTFQAVGLQTLVSAAVPALAACAANSSWSLHSWTFINYHFWDSTTDQTSKLIPTRNNPFPLFFPRLFENCIGFQDPSVCSPTNRARLREEGTHRSCRKLPCCWEKFLPVSSGLSVEQKSAATSQICKSLGPAYKMAVP